jgi:hypothetical protein
VIVAEPIKERHTSSSSTRTAAAPECAAQAPKEKGLAHTPVRSGPKIVRLPPIANAGEGGLTGEHCDRRNRSRSERLDRFDLAGIGCSRSEKAGTAHLNELFRIHSDGDIGFRLLQHHLPFASFKSNKTSGTPSLISCCLSSAADWYTISV